MDRVKQTSRQTNSHDSDETEIKQSTTRDTAPSELQLSSFEIYEKNHPFRGGVLWGLDVRGLEMGWLWPFRGFSCANMSMAV